MTNFPKYIGTPTVTAMASEQRVLVRDGEPMREVSDKAHDFRGKLNEPAFRFAWERLKNEYLDRVAPLPSEGGPNFSAPRDVKPPRLADLDGSYSLTETPCGMCLGDWKRTRPGADVKSTWTWTCPDCLRGQQFRLVADVEIGFTDDYGPTAKCGKLWIEDRFCNATTDGWIPSALRFNGKVACEKCGNDHTRFSSACNGGGSVAVEHTVLRDGGE